MRRSEVRRAAAFRDDGLRRVRKLTWWICAAGAAGAAVMGAGFAHGINHGQGTSGSQTSGSQGTGGQAGSQGNGQQGGASQGNASQGAGSQPGSSQNGGSLQPPAQNPAPAAGPAQGVSGAS